MMKYEVTTPRSLCYFVRCYVASVLFNRSYENLSREFWFWIARGGRARKSQSLRPIRVNWKGHAPKWLSMSPLSGDC